MTRREENDLDDLTSEERFVPFKTRLAENDLRELTPEEIWAGYGRLTAAWILFLAAVLAVLTWLAWPLAFDILVFLDTNTN